MSDRERLNSPGTCSTLVGRAPTRLDFGGGWTDVPPYSDEQGGEVCNVAISRFASVRLDDGHTADRAMTASDDGHPGANSTLVSAALRRAELQHLRVSLSSDFPVGAGLGGSSAACVALAGSLAAWSGRRISPEQVAEESRSIEVEELGIAGGRQDHYAAAFGGALHLAFEATGTRVRRLTLDASRATTLESRLVVAYTGESRISAHTINAVIEGYCARTPRVVVALARMKDIAGQQARAIDDGNFDDLGRLVGEHWVHQRALHPAITTERIETAVERAMAVGALGVKALGASGGGCIVAVATSQTREAVRAAIASVAVPLDITIALRGFEIVSTTRASR